METRDAPRRRPRPRTADGGRRLHSAGSAIAVSLVGLAIALFLNAPGLHKSATIQPEGWKRDVALTKATDIIAANPDVKAFFAANDDMGLGIVKAVENAGKTGQIVVVSVDGNKDALQSVLDGGLSATVAQYPYAIGELGLQACQVALAGKDVPAEIESPTALVTKDNAQQASDAFPQPFEEFENPLTSLLG